MSGHVVTTQDGQAAFERRGRRLPGQRHRCGGRCPSVESPWSIEEFPADLLGARKPQALLFKRLATLRADADVFNDVDALRWRGPMEALQAWTEQAEESRLLERALRAPESLG
jgi:hypothetical protein